MSEKKIKVRLTALSDNYRKFCVVFMNIKLAVAFDRDSGARASYDAIFISGEIGSGGSRANWHCYVNEGSIFEIEIDEEIFNKNKNRIKKWSMEVIPEFSVTKVRSDEINKAADNLE